MISELSRKRLSTNKNIILDAIRDGNRNLYLYVTENSEKTMNILKEHNENCKHLKFLLTRQEGMWESIRYIRNEIKRKNFFMYGLLILMLIFQYLLYLNYILVREMRTKKIDCTINYN